MTGFEREESFGFRFHERQLFEVKLPLASSPRSLARRLKLTTAMIGQQGFQAKIPYHSER